MQSFSLLFRCLSNGGTHYSTFNGLSKIKDFKWQKLYQKSYVAMMSSGRDSENPDFAPPTAIEFSSLEPEQQRKFVETEIKTLLELGRFFVPVEPIPEKHWKELLACDSASSRRKYFKYLRHIEIAKENKLKMKSERQKKREEFKQDNKPNPHLIYALYHNSIFPRINKRKISRHYDNNLRHAVLYGQDIVFDMSYESSMNSHEIKSCVKQLTCLYGANKIDVDPFHLHLCNMPPTDSQLYCETVASIPQWKESGLTEVTSKSYLELFSKDRLVYMTPDCEQDLVEFNHDDVYIIGGLVDRGSSIPESMAKAETEGLRMARLPLKTHLSWVGRKDLTLDQVLKILLTLKNTGDWVKALQHVPRRKIRRVMEVETEKIDSKDAEQPSNSTAKFDPWILVNDLLKDN